MGKIGLVVAVVGTLAFASSAFAGGGVGGCFGATHTAQSTPPPVVVMTTPPVATTTDEKKG